MVHRVSAPAGGASSRKPLRGEGRTRQTHFPHVYVEWVSHRQTQEVTKQYAAPLEERELESMRLEWSYMRGRDDYRLRRDIQDAMSNGCWMEGTFMELRQLQAAGQ